jgi:putative salt-induced outer membrane protein YdiY
VISAALFSLVWITLNAATVVVTLSNGDRITGDFLSEDATQVVILSPLAGRIAIPKSGIAQRAEVPAPSAFTPSNAPTPAPAPAPPKPPATNAPAAKPAPAAPAAPPTATAKAPAATGLTRMMPAAIRPLFTNWHGSLNLGMDVGFGTSDRRTFYLNGNASHAWDRVRNTVDYHVAYGTVNAVQSANRMDGSAKTETDLGKKRRLYIYNQGGAGYDEIRRVDLEFHEGAGLGYKLIQKPKLSLNTEAGLQYQDQDYRNQPRHSFVSARLGENVVWHPVDKLEIRHSLSYTPDIEDFTVVRIRADLSLVYPLFKRITLSLNLVDLYDSRPAISVKNNDLQVQSTIGMSF